MKAVARTVPLTRDALDSIPDNLVGEIIDGVLYTSPRPRPRHASIEALLAGELAMMFQRGRGGPGGWWILIEPGIEFDGSPEVVPDLAGWRRERLPELPEQGPIGVVPDWVCEILSASTRRHDLLIKRPLYARHGVNDLWLVDLEARILIASRLQDGHWLELGVFGQLDDVSAEPFAAASFPISDWWPDTP